MSFFWFGGISNTPGALPWTSRDNELFVSEDCCRGTPEHAKEQLIVGRREILLVSPLLQPQLQPAGLAGLGAMLVSILPSDSSQGKKALCVHEHPATQK